MCDYAEEQKVSNIQLKILCYHPLFYLAYTLFLILLSKTE